MFKPKDIGADGGYSEPLIKIDFSSNDEKSILVILAVGVVVTALFYGLGITLQNAGLTGVSFVLAIITLIVFLFLKTRSSRVPLSDDELDRKVEQYKQDLVDTYRGYDIEYSVDEILDAADTYREDIISQENTHEDTKESQTVSDVFRQMHSDATAKLRNHTPKYFTSKNRRSAKNSAELLKEKPDGFLKE